MPETGTPIPPEFPPMLYLPCAEAEPVGGNITVEMRETKDGRVALLAYSALDRLIRCCGPDQPWVVVPTPNLERLRQSRPFELVLLDVAIPGELRHGGAG